VARDRQTSEHRESLIGLVSGEVESAPDHAPVIRALTVPGFKRLAFSYSVNELGDNLGAVALAILVLDETGSAVAVAAVLLAAKVVPAFVAPALTARLDRTAIRDSLPALYLAEALIFAILALVAGAFWLPAVIGLAMVDGTLALTGRGLSRGAAAAALQPAGLLRQGNSILNVSFAVTSAGGPAVGGLITALGGPAAALGLDAVSFLVAAVVMRGAPGALPAAGEDGDGSWLVRLRSGLRYVRHEPRVRLLLLGEAAALVFFYLVIPIEVVYAKRTLDAGDLGYGLLLAAWGGGIVIGSAVYPRVTHRSPGLLIALSTAGIGAAYLGLAAAPTIGVACGVSVIGGMGNGVQWVAVLTAVQEAVAPHLQARIVGLLESISAATPGIGFVLGGALTALGSPRLAYAVAGVGVFVVLAVMLTGVRRPVARPEAAGT
jgi:MFS family permease